MEIQARIQAIYGTRGGFPPAYRSREFLVAAVLTKRANIPLDSLDLYVNVAGGLQIEDTGVDLTCCHCSHIFIHRYCNSR